MNSDYIFPEVENNFCEIYFGKLFVYKIIYSLNRYPLPLFGKNVSTFDFQITIYDLN